LNEAKHVIRKTKNLQQKYVKLNQLNWKTHNDLTCFQVDLERMTRDYANLEQQNIIIGLEHTSQDLKEQ